LRGFKKKDWLAEKKGSLARNVQTTVLAIIVMSRRVCDHYVIIRAAFPDRPRGSLAHETSQDSKLYYRSCKSKGEFMLRTKNILDLSISGLLIAGMALSANAIAITQGPSTVSAATDFSGSFLFAKFDTSLGTLNSVFLTLGTSLDTTLTVTNNSVDPSSGNAKTELQAALYDPSASVSTAGNILTVTGGSFDVQDDVLTTGAAYNLASGNSTILHPPTKNTDTGAVNITSAGSKSYFSGAGNAAISYKTFTTTVLNNTGGNTSAAQSTTDALSATLVYNYTPSTPSTPEPGTWAMLAAGASTGLVAIRRRRNKK
jgi:hypothetical protein